VKGVRNSSEIQINNNLKYQSLMTLDKKISWGQSNYDSPLVNSLEMSNEGVLCMSSPASTIENAYEEDWGTL
jgi:hypothetical protein